MGEARDLCGFATDLADNVGQGLADSGSHCHACLRNIFLRCFLVFLVLAGTETRSTMARDLLLTDDIH